MSAEVRARVNELAREARERQRLERGEVSSPADDGDVVTDDAADLEEADAEPASVREPLRKPARPSAVPRLLTAAELSVIAAEPVDGVEERPRTRGECADGERPCPFVSCRHHLYLEVTRKTGTIKLNFPDLEVHEMGETCALDVADRGSHSLDEIGEVMNLTYERTRQIEEQALRRLERVYNTDVGSYVEP